MAKRAEKLQKENTVLERSLTIIIMWYIMETSPDLVWSAINYFGEQCAKEHNNEGLAICNLLFRYFVSGCIQLMEQGKLPDHLVVGGESDITLLRNKYMEN